MKERINTLFAYGTLMCEDIMQEVAGCLPQHHNGILKGFKRRQIRGEQYPAVFPDRDACVEGVVYQGVSDVSWDRLDRFEGEMYIRQNVVVGLQDGTTIVAMTYVLRPEYVGCLDEMEWSFTEFLSGKKVLFQRQYLGFQKLS